ncbi:MAG: DUF362 domain-containing protein [Sphaerochaeta sp.]|jgi:uncharacterized protein (DUF362 family)|nr:DUF362 domain-containing protein [Sphaerochaeta sp.]MCH3919582.1 DUF362 domain-containing protein [Sphaerochaeta sp.]MCI2045467.1 DUF362 domain-containing protein [Sphaerochaeta sp.]MCI2096388.1 DUF362 domain-containing protein [Sphaerochaeta sp.]MCI2104889.1 DUF362 domain-containing protein [Sphaerochaeta sp.]
MQEDEITMIYGDDPKQMTDTLLGAIHVERLIPDQGMRVILKPNLVVPATADGGATTHPEIVVSLIEYLQAHGFSNLLIAESAWVGARTDEGFDVNGYREISRKYQVPLLDVKQDAYQTVQSQGITMQISKTVMEPSFLISLPVLKGHCQTRMTCALKNMKGCLSDRSKRMFHSLGLMKPIAALNAARHADLVIVDSICGDLDFEEGGNPVQTGRMFAARDSVLCDAFGASLLGFSVSDIPYIKLAEAYGVGSADLSRLHLTELNHPKTEITARPSGAVAPLARHTCPKDACSACYGNLIHALKRMDEDGKDLPDAVCIGQGYRGVTDSGKTGVGSCTRGLGKSLPGCPPTAKAMVDFLS